MSVLSKGFRLIRATSALRNLNHSRSFPPLNEPFRLSGHVPDKYPSRLLCTSKSTPGDDNVPNEPDKKVTRNRFLDRLLAPDESGQSPVLRMLGYYSPESRAIGAARSMYDQMLERSRATLIAEFSQDDQKKFVPQYEMLAIHVYLTLQRLRKESGSEFEKDVKVAMQTLFDIFWSDVRYRMMIQENDLTAMSSAKWVRQCERNFFSMALAFDETWQDHSKMIDKISIHLTSLKNDPESIHRIHTYMRKERQRLETVSVEQMWEGVCWDPKYPALL